MGLAETKEGDQARTSFDEIVKATARAKDVVRQILWFSRRQESARETISLQPVVEDVLTFLRATLPTNVEFRTTAEPGVPRVSANASQVYQISKPTTIDELSHALTLLLQSAGNRGAPR